MRVHMHVQRTLGVQGASITRGAWGGLWGAEAGAWGAQIDTRSPWGLWGAGGDMGCSGGSRGVQGGTGAAQRCAWGEHGVHMGHARGAQGGTGGAQGPSSHRSCQSRAGSDAEGSGSSRSRRCEEEPAQDRKLPKADQSPEPWAGGCPRRAPRAEVSAGAAQGLAPVAEGTLGGDTQRGGLGAGGWGCSNLDHPPEGFLLPGHGSREAPVA